jgi:hypothetical protein
MDEKEIREFYFNKSPAADSAGGPVVSGGDKVVAGEDDRKDPFELTDSVQDELRKKLTLRRSF